MDADPEVLSRFLRNQHTVEAVAKAEKNIDKAALVEVVEPDLRE